MCLCIIAAVFDCNVVRVRKCAVNAWLLHANRAKAAFSMPLQAVLHPLLVSFDSVGVHKLDSACVLIFFNIFIVIIKIIFYAYFQ